MNKDLAQPLEGDYRSLRFPDGGTVPVQIETVRADGYSTLYTVKDRNGVRYTCSLGALDVPRSHKSDGSAVDTGEVTPATT